MPYAVRKGGGDCAASKWAVVNTDSGDTKGCHDTKASANKQLAALKVNTDEALALHETATISEAAAAEAKRSGRMLVQFISPGWGSSGYYSPEVLEAAVADQVIPVGTHMYADHPTEAEDIERPIRSIKDLMAVTAEDGRLATAAEVAAGEAEAGAVVGEVQVVPQWRDLVETVKDSIGVSIRGSATDVVEGEAEGRRGPVIEGLVAPVTSADFVTRAGRGGKVLQLLESARTSTRAVARGVSEATVNDTRDALHTLLRDTYGGDRTYVWVRDFDDDTVWFEVDSGDDAGLYAQAYTGDGGSVALTGDRTEVRVVTTYVPVSNPAGQSTTTEESEEGTMGKIQVEEAEHSRLVEQAGRVETLEAERDTLKAENTQLREADTKRTRTDRARQIVTERAKSAEVTFSPLEERGLLADLPLKDGALDEEKFTKSVDEAAAEITEAQGAGRVRGFGDPTGPTGNGQVSEDDFDKVFSIQSKGA